jgi:hypothetical protein
MADDSSEPSMEPDGNEGNEPELNTEFDNYRSLRDSNLMIFVAKDVVPPFRFKAGGWELLQSSITLGPAMTTRIAEQGFFMCRIRINEDQTTWIELTDVPPVRTIEGEGAGL